ncbi:peptidyl-prolyl cis-trans isomerase [Altererythrobacter sp.]|uniref:peptidylprolyl isomerase n=1 Tax=Altererythrobacter sp. TaxID=1872480 RepID=UPI003D0EA37B
MKLPGWTREPLVHFLLAGVLVFALFSMRGEEVDPTSRVIDVDRETQASIALGFEQMMGRAPTDAELDSQIDRYVREEVLYREALRLGFDRGDAIVRRRLAQKMDMVASARAETGQPSDETLQTWYAAHPERFADEAHYTLDQLWFSRDDAAKSAMARLKGGADWHRLGERIDLPASLASEPRRELLARFGERFVDEIDRLESGDTWQGPVASGLGWHLVRLSAREPGKVPPFADIRQQVEDDWRSETIAERKEEAYRILRDAYRIEIAR